MTLLGLAGFSMSLHAQVVRGTVREATQRPVTGVLVTLLDSADTPLGRAFSDSAGEFRLLATRPGTLRLRAQRVGYRPTTTASFVVGAGATVMQTLVLDGARTQLDAVRVVARSSCGKVSADDAPLLSVWEQAHTMLSASLLTSSTRGYTTSMLRVHRILDPGGRILDQNLQVESGNFTAPWASQPIATLRTKGYVWADRESQLTYNAPGIDALVSPFFLDDHCFRLVAGKQPSEIGVAFEPVPERMRLTELRGTFWVDRASAELRRLEFQYTNAESMGRTTTAAAAVQEMKDDPLAGGGTMRFVRLPGGAVLIERWELRMPVMTRETFAGRTRTRLDFTETSGGMLLAIRRGRDTLFVQPRVAVRGIAQDSASGRALGNARVRLLGTGYEAEAGRDGRFVLPDVLPGAYTLAVSTAQHDSLGLASGEAVVVRDSMPALTVRVPSAYQLANVLCGGTFAAASRGSRATRGALFGRVTATDDTVGLAGVPVVADWTDTVPDMRPDARTDVRGGRPVEAKRLATTTDATGRYRLCGVPFDVALAVRVLSPDGHALATPAQVTRTHQLAAVPLLVDRSRPATGMLVGTVVSAATGRPVTDAEVIIVGTDRLARTDTAGAFRLDGIPVGTRELSVRRLGFAVTSASLTFAANDVEERRVVLNALTTLESVDVNADRVPMRLTEFEENRRVGLGHFFDRTQLARMDAFPLSSALTTTSGLTLAGGRFPLSSRTPPSLSASAADCLPPGVQHGSNVYNPSTAERNRGVACACYPHVYLDGRLVNPGQPAEPFDLQRVQTREIEAVEWYASPSQLPVQFARLNSTCGVLVLHSRQSGDGDTRAADGAWTSGP